MTYLTIQLDASFHKKIFSCGEASLDAYLQRQAGQDMKRKLCVVFVLPDEEQKDIIKGYYTLSSASISRKLVPQEVLKKMPEAYFNLPVTLLGRLARDVHYKSTNVGENLLLDALKRSFDISKNTIGSIAVVVDPINKWAHSFYTKYGFINLPESQRLFLTMDSISCLF